MNKKKNSKLASILLGPILVLGGIMALWENEGRFNYYEAAKNTTIINSADDYGAETISYTSNLNTDIPISGDYVDQFNGFHVVNRNAEIYAWDERTDSDNRTTWHKEWSSHLDSNSRNSGLTKKLSSTMLYPINYSLSDLEISPRNIHFVDSRVSISASSLTLNNRGVQAGLTSQGSYFYLDKGSSDDIGDERLSYSGIPNAPTATYFGLIERYKGVGKQFEVNTGIVSSLIQNDGILHHLVNGSREEALEKIRSDFVMTVWITRLAGTAAIVLGIFIFLSSFLSLLYRIPLIGRWVESGVFIISLVLGLPIALIVILLGLIINNPLTIALPLALVIGGFVYFIKRSGNTQKNARKILSQRIKQPPPVSPGNPPPVSPGTPPPVPPGSPPSSAPVPDFVVGVQTSAREIIEKTFIHLTMMALADGGLDKSEKKMLMDYGKDNGVTSGRMKELFKHASAGDVESTLANRDDVELLALMALADGELSKKEWNLLNKFAEKTGMSSIELGHLIDNIENDNLSTA